MHLGLVVYQRKAASPNPKWALSYRLHLYTEKVVIIYEGWIMLIVYLHSFIKFISRTNDFNWLPEAVLITDNTKNNMTLDSVSTWRV